MVVKPWVLPRHHRARPLGGIAAAINACNRLIPTSVRATAAAPAADRSRRRSRCRDEPRPSPHPRTASAPTPTNCIRFGGVQETYPISSSRCSPRTIRGHAIPAAISRLTISGRTVSCYATGAFVDVSSLHLRRHGRAECPRGVQPETMSQARPCVSPRTPADHWFRRHPSCRRSRLPDEHPPG